MHESEPFVLDEHAKRGRVSTQTMLAALASFASSRHNEPFTVIHNLRTLCQDCNLGRSNDNP